MNKKALVVINPKAGIKKSNRLLTDIVSELQKGEYLVTVYVTRKQGDGNRFVVKNVKNFSLVVAVGGDGTFNEVVAGVIASGTKTNIGYIPSGSTNDFASTLRLPLSPVKAATNIIKGTPKAFDVGVFNGRVFTYVASFGAFTGSSYNAPQEVKNSIGHLAYIFEGVKDIGNIKGFNLDVKTEEKSFSGRYIFGSISNTTSLGGLLKINEEIVDLSDGKLELMFIKEPKNIKELNQILSAINLKNYIDCPMIDFCSARSIDIITKDDFNWTIDGEKQNGSPIIEVKNIEKAIKLLTV